MNEIEMDMDLISKISKSDRIVMSGDNTQFIRADLYDALKVENEKLRAALRETTNMLKTMVSPSGVTFWKGYGDLPWEKVIERAENVLADRLIEEVLE